MKAPSTTARFQSVPYQNFRRTERQPSPYQSQENLKQMDLHPNHSPWQMDLQSYSNSRYKTEFCRNMDELGACRYSFKCQFAHDMEEMRPKYTHHPHYRTEKCRTYHVAGFCRFGTRCAFIHNGSGRLQNENVIYMASWEDAFYTTDGYFRNTIEDNDNDGYYKNNNGDTNRYFRNKRSNRQWTGASTRKALHMENNKRKHNQQGRKHWSNNTKEKIMNNVNDRNQKHSNSNYNVAYEEYGCSVKQLAGGNKSGDNTNYNYEEMSYSTQGTNSNNLVEQIKNVEINNDPKNENLNYENVGDFENMSFSLKTLKIGQSGNLPFSLERTQVVSNRMELVCNEATDKEQNGRHILYKHSYLNRGADEHFMKQTLGRMNPRVRNSNCKECNSHGNKFNKECWDLGVSPVPSYKDNGIQTERKRGCPWHGVVAGLALSEHIIPSEEKYNDTRMVMKDVTAMGPPQEFLFQNELQGEHMGQVAGIPQYMDCKEDVRNTKVALFKDNLGQPFMTDFDMVNNDMSRMTVDDVNSFEDHGPTNIYPQNKGNLTDPRSNQLGRFNDERRPIIIGRPVDESRGWYNNVTLATGSTSCYISYDNTCMDIYLTSDNSVECYRL